jgi:hypothetical protein
MSGIDVLPCPERGLSMETSIQEYVSTVRMSHIPARRLGLLPVHRRCGGRTFELKHGETGLVTRWRFDHLISVCNMEEFPRQSDHPSRSDFLPERISAPSPVTFRRRDVKA